LSYYIISTEIPSIIIVKPDFKQKTHTKQQQQQDNEKVIKQYAERIAKKKPVHFIIRKVWGIYMVDFLVMERQSQSNP
jgi:hypothetical protein